MTTNPTSISTGACSPVIATADDLHAWQERLSDDRHGTAAILDQHGRPRLLTEGEDGKMYVTSVDDEVGDAPWDLAEKGLFFYGPFTVLHPAAALAERVLPPEPGLAAAPDQDDEEDFDICWSCDAEGLYCRGGYHQARG